MSTLYKCVNVRCLRPHCTGGDATNIANRVAGGATNLENRVAGGAINIENREALVEVPPT